MRKIILTMAALLCFCNSVYAMAPIDAATVKAAAIYGVSKKAATTDQVLAGWTAQDRKETNKFGNNERAIVFTPYLAVALKNHATAAAGGAALTPEENMAIAKEYDGVLAVSLILNSSFKVEPKYLKIRMYQGSNVAEPYYTTLEAANTRIVPMTQAQLDSKTKTPGLSAAEQAKLNAVKKDVETRSKQAVNSGKVPQQKAGVPNTPAKTLEVQVWDLQYFTYFDLSKLDATKHMVLTVADQGGGEREFVLEIPNIK